MTMMNDLPLPYTNCAAAFFIFDTNEQNVKLCPWCKILFDKKIFVWYNIQVLIIRRRIEVVITGLTRNQLYLMVPWVRIPPSPPADPYFIFDGIRIFCK